MSSRITKAAYEKLVTEDLTWLGDQPQCLERDHIEAIVRRSVTLERDAARKAATDALEYIVHKGLYAEYLAMTGKDKDG